MHRRINLYGGPNCGKSATAMAMSADFKKRGLNIEYVDEFVKKWAYLKRKPRGHNQTFLFAMQQHAEEEYLANGVDLIVTDSPLLLVTAYGRRNKYACNDELTSIALKFAKDYPEINIFLDRAGLPYDTNGRYESYEQALEMDRIIKDMFSELQVPFWCISPKDNVAQIVYQVIMSGDRMQHGTPNQNR